MTFLTVAPAWDMLVTLLYVTAIKRAEEHSIADLCCHARSVFVFSSVLTATFFFSSNNNVKNSNSIRSFFFFVFHLNTRILEILVRVPPKIGLKCLTLYCGNFTSGLLEEILVRGTDSRSVMVSGVSAYLTTVWRSYTVCGAKAMYSSCIH